MAWGSSALVGRAAELGVLRRALAEAVRGRSHLLVCNGEAGIGKTRLLTEVAREAEKLGVPVFWARSLELHDAPPYWLWHQVLPAVEVDSTDRAALFERLVAELADSTDATGGLLVVDDIQWADEPSLVALLHVVRALRGRRLLICAAERTHDESAGWRAVKPRLLSEAAVESLAVQSFSLSETTGYLAAVTDRPIGEDFARAVRALTGGNPFYIRELGRSYPSGSGREITGPEGGLDAASGADGGGMSPVLPPRLVDVVHARVASLTPAARELLTSTSILGEEFSLTVAARLVERTVLECLPAADAAMRAGLLVMGTAPGRVTFGHGIVRAALAAELPLERRVRLHTRAALAIEELCADALPEHYAELARHWGEVAITGERGPAAEWTRRAADHAAAVLAHEEADRLYGLTLEYAPATDSADRARLQLAKAIAALRSGRLDAANTACTAGFEIARRLDDAALLAEATLVLEPTGDRGWDRALRDRCDDALARLTDDQPALCARVLARKAETLLYLGEYETVRTTSAAALCYATGAASAATHTDPAAALAAAAAGTTATAGHSAEAVEDLAAADEAFIAALNARQLACSAPEYVGEREVLAGRMVEVGVRVRRAEVEMRGRLWAADTHWQLGRLDEAEREVAALGWCVERVGGPMARWHLLVAQTACAQARGDFAAALEFSRAAYTLLVRLEHPAAFGVYVSQLSAVGHHHGHLEEPEVRIPAERQGDVRNELFGLLGPAFMLLGCGRAEEAVRLYRRTGAPSKWVVPPYFMLDALAVGVHLSVAADLPADIEYFRERFEVWRGHHIAGGAGSSKYFGPVELYLGKTAAALSMWDRAEADFTAAERISTAAGAPGFAVEAEAERASARARRGDVGAARTIAERTLPRARALVMTPWIARLEALGNTVGAQQLSPREQEVAALIAAGHSNREIARTLVISERTAQNHVQHILIKLGYSKRSQIAVWAARG